LLALGRVSKLPAIKAICVGFIELVRGVPLISVLFMASVMIPLFFPDGIGVNKLTRAIIAFSLFEAAYMAESVRAGLQALPKGQYEAAEALGLGYWTRTNKIILPQSLKLVIPPLVNNVLSTFKDTSLVLVIGLYDLLTTAKVAIRDVLWKEYYIEVFLFVGLIYFLFCLFLSRYSQMIERVLNAHQNRQ
ncbi:MAG: amino acid ABC transporter permease, partial [Alphaproteobacteria bacterium]|nr:amino acid ABC transporter permease [Alphaproteobacteria bacterium]